MLGRSLPHWKVLGVELLCLTVQPVVGQAPSAAKKPPPACKGSSRVSWNNCIGTYTTTEGALYVGEDRFQGAVTDGATAGPMPVALVIGNHTYVNVPSLRNARAGDGVQLGAVRYVLPTNISADKKNRSGTMQ